jgi:hypothetical protein
MLGFFQYLAFQRTLNAHQVAQSKIEPQRADVELAFQKFEVGLKQTEGDLKSSFVDLATHQMPRQRGTKSLQCQT